MVDEELIDSLARGFIDAPHVDMDRFDDPTYHWDEELEHRWDRAFEEMQSQTELGLAILIKLKETVTDRQKAYRLEVPLGEYFTSVRYPLPPEAWAALRERSWVQDMLLTWFGHRVALSDFPRRIGRLLVDRFSAAYPGSGKPVWPTESELAEWDDEVAAVRVSAGATDTNPDPAADRSPLASLRELLTTKPHGDGLSLHSLIASVPDDEADDLLDLASENPVILAALLDGLDSVAQSREPWAFGWLYGIEDWTFGWALVDEVGRLVARPGLAILPRRSP